MSEILVYVKQLIADNNLKWQRPNRVTSTFAEFVNGKKILNFEIYDNKTVDCYFSFGKDRWEYTNKPERFPELWQRFVE
jgi:hypothetical protein